MRPRRDSKPSFGEDAADFRLDIFFGHGPYGVALRLEVADRCFRVFVGMDQGQVQLIGELEEASGGLFGRDDGVDPGDGLDGPVPPFIEEVGGFPLEEAEAIGGGGEVGGGVAVSTLADEQEEEGDDDEGEGSFHGCWRVCRSAFRERIAGGATSLRVAS